MQEINKDIMDRIDKEHKYWLDKASRSVQKFAYCLEEISFF